MDWLKAFNRFDFYNDQTIYYFIHSVTAIQFHSLVIKRQWYLGLDRYSPQTKLVLVTGLISRFQKTWSQTLMHLDRSSYDLVGQPICPFLCVYIKLLCALCAFVVS